jgi:hypothetical protein
MLADEFRVNHRAASESLLRSVSIQSSVVEIRDELNRAFYFETEAMRHITTPRERALGMGLLHAIDLLRAVTEAEFL